MFLYTLRNPDKVKGLVGIATAADHTQQIWKGLDREKRQEVQRSGLYQMPSPDSPDPIPISMDLIHDGAKYSILDMPGTYMYWSSELASLPIACKIQRKGLAQ